MSMMSRATDSARWTAVLSVWATLLGLAQIAVLARYLAPADFGTLAFLSILIVFCDVFIRVGFSDVIISARDMSSSQLSTLYWFNIISGVLVYGFLFLCAPLTIILIENDQAETLMRVLGLSLILGSTTVQFEALARKNLRFKVLALIGIVVSIVTLVVAVTLAVRGYGVWSLVVSAVAGQALRSVALWIYAWRSQWLPAFVFRYNEALPHLRHGLLRVGASFINNINTRSDQLAIGLFLGPVELGYYSLAYNIAMKPFQKINPILTQISFPIFAKISHDLSRVRAGYRSGMRMILSINAPLMLGYAAIAPLLIPAILGGGWEPIVTVSQVLAVYALFRSAGSLNIGIILSQGKFRWPFYWNLFLLFLIPFAIFLVSIFTSSLLYVAIVLVLIQFLLFVLGYILFVRRLLGAFGREFFADFALPVSISLAMAFSVAAIASLVEARIVYCEIAVLIAFGGTVYIAISLILQKETMLEIRKLIFPSNEKNA